MREARQQARAVERTRVRGECGARREEGGAADREQIEGEEAAPLGEEVRAGDEASPEAAHATRCDEGLEREIALDDEQEFGGEVGDVHGRVRACLRVRAVSYIAHCKRDRRVELTCDCAALTST